VKTTGSERTTAVSPQTQLGLGALRVLAHWPRDWAPADLAEALGARPDLLAEVVSRLVAAGWVHAAVRSGRLSYRYADPQPAPTLYETIQAVEGASVADDCVLGLGPCAGLSGGATCTAHTAWLRELGWSALIATPLVPTVTARWRIPDGWRTWGPGDGDGARASAQGATVARHAGEPAEVVGGTGEPGSVAEPGATAGPRGAAVAPAPGSADAGFPERQA